MSHRPINSKRARRMRKVIARRPLARNINLVEWLEDRGHAQTAGQARKMLEAGRVKTFGGNIVGREMLQDESGDTPVVSYYAAPVVSAKIKDELTVVPA